MALPLPPLIPMAVSMGDPAGVGPEIIAAAWAARDDFALAPFVVAGSPYAFGDWPTARVASPEEAVAVFPRALPLIDVTDGDAAAFAPGKPTPDSARAAFAALDAATRMVRAGHARALVTAPVAKSQLQAIGFAHPGQTEYLAALCGTDPARTVMMLAGIDLDPPLRVVPLTIHIPLREVPEALTADRLKSQAHVTAKALHTDFGIANPRLAVAGLNPHAGEQGTMGREEIETLAPAIAALRGEGLDISGPYPADTLFHARARAGFDAALCPYHDQALIPIKTIAFDQGVNVTLGLPIVRTSPDHGTAFDIAGSGKARPDPMIAALRMADAIATAREADSKS